jgi:hypothetical protein
MVVRVMRSPVLQAVKRRMIKAQGQMVPIHVLQKVVGPSRRAQGVMYEMRQHKFDVKIVKDDANRRKAAGYILKRVPKSQQGPEAAKATKTTVKAKTLPKVAKFLKKKRAASKKVASKKAAAKKQNKAMAPQVTAQAADAGLTTEKPQEPIAA